MKKLLALLLAMCMLLLCGCGQSQEETTEPSSEESNIPSDSSEDKIEDDTPEDTSDEKEDEEEEIPPIDINPLTGEALDEVSDVRPFAIMINNHRTALPHGGVAEADIIYEALVEGWGTRYMAIFTDATNAGPIGSVRSCRPPFVDVVQCYDAIYSSVSGEQLVLNRIYNNGVDYINAIYDSKYFYRDEWRMNNMGYEHSMMIDGSNLLNIATDFGIRTTREVEEFGFTFDDSVELEGNDVGFMNISFRAGGKTTGVTYDQENNVFYLSQYGIDYTDANTQEKVPFRNIFVLHCNTYVLENGVHVQSETVGEGTGYYLRDGKVASIKWSRENVDSPFVYTLEDGSELVMGVGTTYVALIALDGTVEYYT